MTDIVVWIQRKKEITVLISKGGTWWGGWTVTINNDNFLWFLDASKNIATKWATIIDPAIVSWVAPTPEGGYYFVETAWYLNIDNIARAESWQTVFFRQWLRNVETNSTALIEQHLIDNANPHDTSFSNILWNARDNTELQTALDLKANNQASSSIATTVTMLLDTMHWTYWTPLTWNLTIDTTWAVRWVVCTVRHNSGTAPTITWGILHSWEYEMSVVNMIQIIFDWIQAIYTISS